MDIELQEKNTKFRPLIESSIDSIHSSSFELNSAIPYQEYEHSYKELPIPIHLSSQFYKYRFKFLHNFSYRLPLFHTRLGASLCFFLLSLLFLFSIYYNEISESTIKKKRKFSGLVASISIGLAFTFACHNSVWMIFLGLPFERGLFWHKFFNYWGLILGLYHGLIGYPPQWTFTENTGISIISLTICIAITSFYLIRRKWFRFFQISHWILILGIAISLSLHEATCALFGLLLWILDLFIRFYIIRTNQRKSKMVTLLKLPSNILRVSLQKKSLVYKPGQYVFLCFPAINFYEFHPFSISSSPSEDQIHLHIRVLGDWTRKLYDSMKGNVEEVNCYIDGPYGNPMINIDNEDIKIFIMISGGIGITPLQSICNELMSQKIRGRKLKKILFIWSVKDMTLMNNSFIDGLPHEIPLSFQPDGLEYEETEILECKFHLTNSRKESEFYKGNIHPSKQKNLRLGRANLDLYLKNIVNFAKKEEERKVGVLCCGPERMVDEVKGLVGKYSQDEVLLEFHEEIFEF